MIAVIKTGGKQYKVKAKDKVRVEKLAGEEGQEIILDQVLLKGDDKTVEVGNPVVKGAKVTAKILKQGRGNKIEVVHYKSKTRHHKKYGHRQPFTELEIVGIG